MTTIDLQTAAGIASTLIFMGSNLPMILKALATKDMRSYSAGQISLANAGNLLHWFYLLGLPAGPIHLLHGFNTLVALLMLALYYRYRLAPQRLIGQKMSSF